MYHRGPPFKAEAKNRSGWICVNRYNICDHPLLYEKGQQKMEISKKLEEIFGNKYEKTLGKSCFACQGGQTFAALQFCLSLGGDKTLALAFLEALECRALTISSQETVYTK